MCRRGLLIVDFSSTHHLLYFDSAPPRSGTVAHIPPKVTLFLSGATSRKCKGDAMTYSCDAANTLFLRAPSLMSQCVNAHFYPVNGALSSGQSAVQPVFPTGWVKVRYLAFPPSVHSDLCGWIEETKGRCKNGVALCTVPGQVPGHWNCGVHWQSQAGHLRD